MDALSTLGCAMKAMTARDAKNHFGEFIDTARREPVLVTKNDRPVGIFISIEDAVDTLIPERFMDPEAGYDAWLAAKVGTTLARVDVGTATLHEHEDAIAALRARIAVLTSRSSGE